MTEHTPGPWRARGQAVFTATGDRVMMAYGNAAVDTQANARLIAAAPDLLAALAALLDEFTWQGGVKYTVKGSVNQRIREGRAAIAKAHGAGGERVNADGTPTPPRSRVELAPEAGCLSAYDLEHIPEILGGMGDWFAADLLRLIRHADTDHREALRLGFPAEVAAFENWFFGGNL